MNNNFKLGKEIDLLEKYPKAKEILMLENKQNQKK